MKLDLEKARLVEKLDKKCTWVFDTDLCIMQSGITNYSVSMNDRERKDTQHVISINVPDFESTIAVLESISKVGGSVINGLGQSYNSLIRDESETFVLNVYKYLHTDSYTNYPSKNNRR